MRTTNNLGRNRTGLNRRSCAWTDAVGPGFATGASQRLMEHVAASADRDYCPEYKSRPEYKGRPQRRRR